MTSSLHYQIPDLNHHFPFFLIGEGLLLPCSLLALVAPFLDRLMRGVDLKLFGAQGSRR
jgi:hypothetical protein